MTASVALRRVIGDDAVGDAALDAVVGVVEPGVVREAANDLALCN